MKLLKGTVLSFTNNPFLVDINDSIKIIESGGILVEGSFIKKVGEFSKLKSYHPNARVYDYGKSLITSGFIDCHMHYPQTGIIASYGKRLLDWLNEYTFPEEKKFTILKEKIAGEEKDRSELEKLCKNTSSPTLALKLEAKASPIII